MSEELDPKDEAHAGAGQAQGGGPEPPPPASDHSQPQVESAQSASPNPAATGRGEEAAEEGVGMEESMDFAMLQDVQPGQILEGKVVHISSDGVLVDVGAKSEGLIHLQDLSHRRIERPEDVVHIGDTIKVYVVGWEGEEGALRLSKRRADEIEAWERLERHLQSGEPLEAPVTEVVKGGLVVDVGLRGFVPASHVARGFVSDLSPYLGQTLRLKVIELDRSKRRAILSHKVLLEEEQRRARERLWAEIEEGQIRQGVVKSLTDFGAFIDLGGVDGLLHISEISWGRIRHPSDVLKEGQPITVKVLRLDREREKISLGYRQVQSNPWDTVAERYIEGRSYRGKVVRLASFGAFVELEPGVDGLVHISQLADHRVSQPSDVVSVGDVIAVKVLRVDPVAKRISLSKRDADESVLDVDEPAGEGPPAEETGPSTIGEHVAYRAGEWKDDRP